MALPTIGTVAYGLITFDEVTKTKLTGKPVHGEDGRTVKYVEWTLDVKGYVRTSPGQSTDIQISSMRQQLLLVGQRLQYSSKGFGTLDVNGPGFQRDVAWGPWPEVMSYTPLGSTSSALVEWRVTFRIPECGPNALFRGAPLTWAYDAAFDFDEAGYTVVRITGTLEIAVTRTAGGTVPDIVDAYRERVRPLPIIGFRREQSHRVNRSHSKLDFTITDTELPYPLPVGCAVADIQHDVEGRYNSAFFECTISGTIRVFAGVSKVTALDRFRLICARLMFDPVPGNEFATLRLDTPGAIQPGLLLIQHVKFGNQVFGKDTTLSVKYRLVPAAPAAAAGVRQVLPLVRLVQASKIWTPMAFTHNDWNNDNSMLVRGNANLRMDLAGDVLLDLCNQPPFAPVVRGGAGASRAAPPLPPVVSGSRDRIPPESSWLDYFCDVELLQPQQIARHKPLAGVVTPTNQFPIMVSDDQQARLMVAPGSECQDTIPDIIQAVTSPSVRLRVYGISHRLSYKVDPPKLISVGGVACTEADRSVTQGIREVYAGVPTYFTRWSILYDLPLPVKMMPVPGNPRLGVAGSIS